MTEQLTLNPGQQAAADSFIDMLLDPQKKVLVISGKAGTGKSTLTKELIRLAPKVLELGNVISPGGRDPIKEMVVTATTNKAARVVADMIGGEPRTIHSLLGLSVRPDFATGQTKLVRGKNAQITRNSIVVIDEASYIDIPLISAINDGTLNCKLLLLGDKDQLVNGLGGRPPVFDSNLPTAYLTEVVRNQGAIQEMALRYQEVVETGVWPTFELPDCPSVQHLDGAGFRDAVDTVFTKPDLAPDDARILCWTNGRVHQYNSHVRELRGLGHNIQADEVLITNKPIVSPAGTAYSTDSLVRVTSIGQEDTRHGIDGRMIHLGAVGLWVFAPYDQEEVKQLLKHTAKAKDWKTHFAIKEDWVDLRPIHASTVHKSQGSTLDTVFIDLDDIGRCTQPNTVARLLYVAISRARHKVVFYGKLPARYGG
jgi:hypothetical protein